MSIFQKAAITLPFLAAGALVTGAAQAATGVPLLQDDFSGSSADEKLWHIPTWTSPTDGTYIGRTQFRVTQDSGLPATADGSLVIPIETHNPKQTSFLAAEVISNQEFSVGTGLDIVIRAKMNAPLRPGVVGGLFLYALQAGSDTIHDEIDFELLTNKPDQVQTNIYGHEPLGIGHVEFIPYQTGSMTDFHNYEIKWTPKLVSWLIDGKLVRTTTSNIPAAPMRFYVNAWAPDEHWPQAYSATIQPTASADANEMVGAVHVDSITIRPLTP